MPFSDEEITYLRSQRLGRLATVASDGQPDVVPVGYEFDGAHVYVGGLDVERTRKFRNVQDGNTKVALVVDDLVSANPWTARYVRIYGSATPVERAGSYGPGTYLEITPTVSWSSNLEARPLSPDREVVIHRTVHEPEYAGRASPQRDER